MAIWGIPFLLGTPLYLVNSCTAPVRIFFKAADKILKLLNANFKDAEKQKKIGFWNLPSKTLLSSLDEHILNFSILNRATQRTPSDKMLLFGNGIFCLGFSHCRALRPGICKHCIKVCLIVTGSYFYYYCYSVILQERNSQHWNTKQTKFLQSGMRHLIFFYLNLTEAVSCLTGYSVQFFSFELRNYDQYKIHERGT